MATSVSTRPGLHRLLRAPLPLRLWHLASLDAPTVAVTWMLAFAWAASVRLPLWLPAILALSAWTFYIADRLLDFRRSPTSSALRERHHYHHRHRRIFIPLAITSAATATTLVLLNMPPHAQARNSLLAAAALVYFTGVHTAGRTSPDRRRRVSRWLPGRLFPKELLVAVVFTAACTVPVLARTALRVELIAPILCFTALAWLNCHAIEAWESPPQHPAARLATTRLALALCAAALLSAAAGVTLHHPRIAALLLSAAISSALLALLDQLRPGNPQPGTSRLPNLRARLTPLTLRAAADLVLLTPLLLLLLA